MMNRKYVNSARRGFTIIELIAAVAATSVMLWVINRLFFDTARALRNGTSVSQIVAGSRAISDQVYLDTQQMVGPGNQGVLVIINKIIPNVTVELPDGPEVVDIRSDQLVFIRNAEGLEPMCPGGNMIFSNRTDAQFARIWYGHVLRTDPNGTGPIAGDLGTGPNANGINWILGRQALFFEDDVGVSSIHANNIVNDAVVVGHGSGLSTPGLDLRLYTGLTDIAWYSFNNPASSVAVGSAPVGAGPGNTNRLLVGDLGSGALLKPIGTLANGGMSASDYRLAAHQLAFNDNNQRLRVNPIPHNSNYMSSQVAQMHPYFVENVSDFVVEFAFDWDDDSTLPIGAPNFPDNEPDLDGDTNATTVSGKTRNLKWYGLGNLPTGPNRYPNPPGPLTTQNVNPYWYISNNEVRWVFRHDYGLVWPYLIRIRYRIHDARGRFTGENQEPGQWFEQIFAVPRQQSLMN